MNESQPSPNRSDADRSKITLPLSILLLGAIGLTLLVATKPQPPKVEGEKPAPMLRVTQVNRKNIQLYVTTHGTVMPRTQSELVPEVSGTIVWVSPTFNSGGFFEAGDKLLRIDPRDSKVALEQARATLARRKSEHKRTQKELSRKKELSTRNVASRTQLDDAENAEHVAAAELRAAEAVLARAERDLERTTIRAPFTGRVREEQVGVGQFIDRGRPIATIYSVDYAEVRLPLPDDQLAFLNIQLSHGSIEKKRQPRVALYAHFAGGDYTWQGRIVRTEGEIDAKSRMVHVIARVDDPYGRNKPSSNQDDNRPPLAVGLFVKAEIEGRQLNNVFVIPRSALRKDAEVLIVDDSNRLRLRHVHVVRIQGDDVIIDRGLAKGERAVVSDLDIVVEGMKVRTSRALNAPEQRAGNDS